MIQPFRARRISGAICIGVGLGILAWIFLPIPRVPVVQVFQAVIVEPLAQPFGLIRARGIETPEQSVVRIVFVGDVMFDRDVAPDPFRDIPSGWFDSFDFAVVNLEGPVTNARRPPEKTIDFLFDPSTVEILKQQGIDAVSQANNHTLDQGAIGFEDSVRRLREAGLLVFGHQVRDDAISLATTTVRGMRLAFVGFNTTDNALNRTQAASVIASAKQEADAVIVFVHWGSEYRNRPDASSIETAHWLVDQGVDAVIGSHPHWAQGFSSYKNKPIAWSLGNFIFDQNWSAQTQQGVAVVLDIRKAQSIERKVEIVIEPIPIQITKSRPHIVEGEEKIQRLESLATLSDEDLREQIRAGKMEF